MLKVQKFIRSNPNWRDLLTHAPYFIGVSEETIFGRNLVLLKYDQIRSDFSNDLVKECRGLILDADTYEVVCCPFFKFFNYGEEYAADIDWSTASVQNKVDGSLVKIVNLDGNFLISTNGTIDAFHCDLQSSLGAPCGNFGDLTLLGFQHYGLQKGDFPRLFSPGYTYMFELTSPWNQVVVQWNETKVTFIGVRDNTTLKEISVKDSPLAAVFDTPEVFPLKSIDDCVAAANALPDDAEGYVVCDANFNRVKVKSPRYVQLHHMGNNQNWSACRVLEILLSGEVSEYASYFPRFKAAADVLKGKYDAYLNSLKSFQNEIDEFFSEHYPSKKEFAKWVFSDPQRKVNSPFAFAYFDCAYGKSDKGIMSAEDFVSKMRISQLADALHLPPNW